MNGNGDSRIKIGQRVLLGGSFDPPTRAHVQLIRQLSLRFDEVIVCPARLSPFKAGASADGGTRFALLKACTEPFPNVTVSDYELNAEGVSYTYRTAQHYQLDGSPLYFAIGSDMLARLHEWARPDILAQTVVFYVIPRPGYAVDETAVKAPFRLKIADFSGEDGSSTAFRIEHAFGRGGEVSPQVVVDYAVQAGLYQDWFYITKRYGDYRLSARRIDHCRRVALCALDLALSVGADTTKCIRASLLHDIGKHTPVREVLTGADADAAEALPQPIRHAPVSAGIAVRDFAETDEEVLAAVKNHTVGRAGMSLVEQVVFIADYIEPGRDFDGLPPIRVSALHNLDKATALIYQNTVGYLTAHGMEIDPKTFDAWHHYKVLSK